MEGTLRESLPLKSFAPRHHEGAAVGVLAGLGACGSRRKGPLRSTAVRRGALGFPT